MKAIKIIFAILAALWALAPIPKLLAGLTHSGGAYAFTGKTLFAVCELFRLADTGRI